MGRKYAQKEGMISIKNDKNALKCKMWLDIGKK